jgi:hypothetical protein
MMSIIRFKTVLYLTLIFALSDLSAQQIPDTSYSFPINKTAYQKGRGSIIYIDEAHNNFHTKSGGFFAFGKLMEQDGYRVHDLKEEISSPKVLDLCKVLVIANALNEVNSREWILPTPSAFTDNEIAIIKNWVMGGGSLLLIADHMPFAGAAYDLGKAFGFEFINGFAYTSQQSWPPSIFTFSNGTLLKSRVTEGLTNYERIDSIATFTGSALKAPYGSTEVFSFLAENNSLQPDTAWVFRTNTPKQSLEGFCQGAIMGYGKGRIAVFGEAAMFTAQVVNGTFKVGFNSESAPHNAQFVLNLIHWLDGITQYYETD